MQRDRVVPWHRPVTLSSSRDRWSRLFLGRRVFAQREIL